MPDTKKYRIIYQPYLKAGAFEYIDAGFIWGFRSLGHTVLEWNLLRNHKPLEKVLRNFKPEIFVGYLQQCNEKRENFPWAKEPMCSMLKSYKDKNPLLMAAHSNPNIKNVFTASELKLDPEDPSGAYSFYNQELHPNAIEQRLLDDGLIDIIRSFFSSEINEKGFSGWLEGGGPVLEEPLAADTSRYRLPLISRRKIYDLSYVGGWWPFKAQQLEKFISPLKEKYGNRMVIYGKGWPKYSEGFLKKGHFKNIIWKSKINIVLHEPSQVLGFPIHVNERIYKIYACGGFAICDNNVLLKKYFADDEIVIAESPEDMMDKVDYYLKHDMEREEIAQRGRRRVLQEHTYCHRAKRLLDVIQEKKQGILKYKDVDKLVC